MNKSLTQRVLEFVNRHEQSSISQAVAAVGRYIDTAHAASAGRGMKKRWKTDKDKISLIDKGKRYKVSQSLRELARTGRIRRISPGVFAPVLKLFNPAQSA